MLKIVLAAALLLTGGVAVAADTAPEKDKVICKRVAGTGWRLSNSAKVCKSRKEWDAITRETRKEYRDYGRTGSQGNIGN